MFPQIRADHRLSKQGTTQHTDTDVNGAAPESPTASPPSCSLSRIHSRAHDGANTPADHQRPAVGVKMTANLCQNTAKNQVSSSPATLVVGGPPKKNVGSRFSPPRFPTHGGPRRRLADVGPDLPRGSTSSHHGLIQERTIE